MHLHESGRGTPSANRENMSVEKTPRTFFVKRDLLAAKSETPVDREFDVGRFSRWGKVPAGGELPPDQARPQSSEER
jgi:hypothetical protein